MIIKARYLVFILLIINQIFCHSTSPQITDIKYLTHSKGLSSDRVFKIIQDKTGAIWISTKSGVDRYNGTQIKNYNLGGNFYFGDLAGRMIHLYEDIDKNIWAYDNTGRIYKYSSIYDRFDMQHKVGDKISGNINLNTYIRIDKDKELFGLTQGLYIKSGENKVKQLLGNTFVNDIVEIGENWYIGTNSGLRVLTKDMKVSMLKTFGTNNIQTLYYDKDSGKLLIGTFNDGLWIMDHQSLQFSHVNSQNDIFTNPIRAIIKLKPNIYAIGIDGSGIYTFDLQHEKIELLVNSEDNKDFCLHGNGIYTLLKDSQNNLWAGSYTGGVSFISFTGSPSRLITHKSGNKNSLTNNNVNAISENTNGDIWFATDCGVSIQHQSGLWSHALNKSVGVTLCPTTNENMVLGTYGEGIFILDKYGKTLKKLNKQTGQLTSNYIFSIKRDTSGEFWVGALDGNLMNLDKNGKLKQEYRIKLVLSITIIDDSRIAAATADGFYIINKKSKTSTHYAFSNEQANHNVSAYIIPMLFNNNGTVWLGTEGGGLNLYDINKRKITRNFNTTDGLPSNDIFSLQTDSKGRLWLSTGSGIAVIEDSVVISLNYLKGVEKEYNKSASTKLKCGDFIFGGISGAVRISPSEINKVNYVAPLRISGFNIDGVSDENKESLTPVLHNDLKNNRIKLAYNQNNFTVNFESINHSYQEDIAYKYILKGYDTDWSKLTTAGIATYKNVNPGKYILHICTISKCNGKVIDEKMLEIIVSQPWWNNWWAWILYSLLFVLTVYFVVRYKWYQLQKKYNEDKIRFFINIAHNIRTPITLAMAPIEDIRKDEQLSSNANFLLDVAWQNIRKLNSISNQLLDFEKIDTGKHLLKLQTIDVRNLLSKEVGCFENICERKSIKLSLSVPNTSTCILGDTYLLEMVLNNLLSNACKYTPPGGQVKVALYTLKNKVIIDVIDSGIGIPLNEHKRIFSNVHRAQNALETQEIGTGFGLLQVKRIIKLLQGDIEFKSKEGEGSTFTVSFKQVSQNEIDQTTQTTYEPTADLGIPSFQQIDEKQTPNNDATILIVEDNDDLRNYLYRVFSTSYTVVLKPTADEALTYLSGEYPDLVISDVMMPGTQGDDFCNIIKNNPDTAGIPVILLSAKAEQNAVVTGLKKGADDYLAKPFSSEILKLKVKGMIENRNRLRSYILKKAVEQATTKTSTNQYEQTPATELSESDRKFMEKITSIIINNPGESQVNINMLCKEMAMSRTLLYSRLKSLTGKAPQEFIRILNLERAAEMLKQGMTVTEVADATGFVNVKYFSTIFKKHFGVQPSKFTSLEK